MKLWVTNRRFSSFCLILSVGFTFKIFILEIFYLHREIFSRKVLVLNRLTGTITFLLEIPVGGWKNQNRNMKMRIVGTRWCNEHYKLVFDEKISFQNDHLISRILKPVFIINTIIKIITILYLGDNAKQKILENTSYIGHTYENMSIIIKHRSTF